MKLTKVEINNFRSIENLNITLEQLDDSSSTLGLIGVNESGKTSILKALSLASGQLKATTKDFRNKTTPIVVNYFYSQEGDNLNFTEAVVTLKINYENPEICDLSVTELKPSSEIEEETAEVRKTVLEKFHKAIFWTAEDKYLISKPISLTEFAENPSSVSIPLTNCFHLSGFTDIKGTIGNLTGDSTEVEFLTTQLGKKVTEHISTIWPSHPVDISFLIDSGYIHFHVKDKDSSSKPKTADQRSDGFKQFVSFLLTISAENINEELTNTILLLDEPETHLHPKAQEFLLKELIKITSNTRNNFVFFATHSIFMIDKVNLGRNFKVIKEKDSTSISKFDEKSTSYAEVIYEVFDIPTNDYHNELFGYLEEIKKEKLDELKKTKKWKNLKTNETWDVSLPTYIRHTIHHPENSLNEKFTIEDLEQSINILRPIKYE